MTVDAAVKEFFSAYETAWNKALTDKRSPIDSITSAFAAYFVGASPGMVRGGKNNWFFTFMVKRGFAFYRKVGVKAMTITEITTIPINEHHVTVKVRWTTKYTRPADKKTGSIDFENIYFVQLTSDGPKIFSYITGDEQRTMKEHGLL